MAESSPTVDWTFFAAAFLAKMRSIVAKKGANPMEGFIYAGGEFRRAADASVSVLDHGLLYGDGIFEGIRAYNGRVFKLERHLERLFESARAIRLDIPATPGEVEALVLEACRRNGIEDGYVRLIVTPGG